MKVGRKVPNDVKLQKDVPLAMIKGSTVFVNYLAALCVSLSSNWAQNTDG